MSEAPPGSAAAFVITTYRYLRLAMVVLVALLAVAVLRAGLSQRPPCWEHSISAYYYTPARAVLVGALVAVGACLVALRGNSEGENVLLNLAGMLAFGVALVPTPAGGSCPRDTVGGAMVPDSVANNLFAALVVGAVVAAWTVAVAWRRRPTSGRIGMDLLGAVAGAVIIVVAASAFVVARDTVLRWGHDVSSIAMFLCLIAVMAANAIGVGRERTGRGGLPVAAALRTGYAVVGAAMVLTLVVVVVLTMAGIGIAHLVLLLEAALIGEFAAFWLIQTRELWTTGLRPARRP